MPHVSLLQRLMSNLALSRIRTGIAAAIAEDRQCSVRRKLELLLGPTPWEEALGILPGMLDNSAADKAAQKDNTIVTSTGRRIKVRCNETCSTLQEVCSLKGVLQIMSGS
jgi:hypothetical protein